MERIVVISVEADKLFVCLFPGSLLAKGRSGINGDKRRRGQVLSIEFAQIIGMRLVSP